MTDAPEITQNANGIWMLSGEQLWDATVLPVCLEHIKEGDTVIDAGAWIGGHTMAYAKKVFGDTGKVFAFEPNPVAFHCLSRNTGQFPNVYCFPVALRDLPVMVNFSAEKGRYDSGYVGHDSEIATVMARPLDDFKLAPNFIKMDVEGCELKMLKGAAKTIDKFRPEMVIEINGPALERQGDTREQVFDWLIKHDYTYQPIDNYMNDIYNILTTP